MVLGLPSGTPPHALGAEGSWHGKRLRQYRKGHTSGAGRGRYAPLHAPARWYRELEKSKQLLLVGVSADRVGQRVIEHNRSSSPPDSRRLTGFNGVTKQSEGLEKIVPTKFRFWQITRETRSLGGSDLEQCRLCTCSTS
jgi:hypothetical protein